MTIKNSFKSNAAQKRIGNNKFKQSSSCPRLIAGI